MKCRFHGGHNDCSGWWAEDSDVTDEGIINRAEHRCTRRYIAGNGNRLVALNFLII